MHLRISSDTSIDLQMHTTYSDGRWSAEQLFDYLAQEGFGLVAVTDHDRIDTIASIQHLGEQKQVPVLAAVEISAEFQGKMADVLCFGFDPHDQALRAIADHVRQRQKDNAEEVYEELLRRGYQFPQRKAHLTATAGELRVAGDCGTLLIKQEYVNDWSDALELVKDAGYREMKADMHQTVEAVHRSGGVALIAHPSSLSERTRQKSRQPLQRSASTTAKTDATQWSTVAGRTQSMMIGRLGGKHAAMLTLRP